MVWKSLAACALVIGVDHLGARLGWARLGLSMVVYVLVVVATGAVRLGEIAGTLRAALRARSDAAEPVLAREEA
jgi:hypothetical protein